MLPPWLFVDMLAWPRSEKACPPSWRERGGSLLTRLLRCTECEHLPPVTPLHSSQVSAEVSRAGHARSAAVPGNAVRFMHRGRIGPTESMGIPPWNR